MKLLSRFRSRGPSASDRRHARHECECIGTLAILNRSIWLEGIFSEVSRGGLKFRPAKTYVLDRGNTPVLCEFSDFRTSGKIVASRVDGYGIALLQEIEETELENFLEEYALGN